MTTTAFRAAPWRTSHVAYEKAFFVMSPAPEFATAEVLLASTYRASGFAGHSETKVPVAGRAFDKASSKSTHKKAGRIGAEAWKTILHGALQSPKQRQQSSRRFLQLSPVVPDTSLYSGSARLAGNSWNAGELIARMVCLGTGNHTEANSVWADLHDGLSVTNTDDVWARWLQAEFEARRTIEVDWNRTQLPDVAHFTVEERASLSYPARQFVLDLRAVLQAKETMTRRQWVSILESVLRLGAVAHVLWVCEVHDRLWRLLRGVLNGAPAPCAQETTLTVFNELGRPLVYGVAALPLIREMASRYLSARLGINLLLWQLEERGFAVNALATAGDVHGLIELINRERGTLDVEQLTTVFEDLCDQNARELNCKKGVGNNMVEFCRYALGQRQTADDTLRGYDQGYQLRKKAEYASAPWVVSLGPVALLAFTHCCLLEATSPRSVLRLCEHLGHYGIDIDRDDIADSEVGMKLRMLGLVLDSPDAESGMLLVPPFGLHRKAMEQL